MKFEKPYFPFYVNGGCMFYLPWHWALSPRPGNIIQDHHWVCHPHRGLCFWYASGCEEPSPQCNQDLYIAREDIEPGHTTTFQPLVFAAHAETAMKQIGDPEKIDPPPWAEDTT